MTFVEPLLLWKGNAVGASSGISHPEGSGTGPGLTALHEWLSHEQVLACMSGHGVLAALCGSQCAVPLNATPTDNEFLHGVWVVTTFDSLGFG